MFHPSFVAPRVIRVFVGVGGGGAHSIMRPLSLQCVASVTFGVLLGNQTRESEGQELHQICLVKRLSLICTGKLNQVNVYSGLGHSRFMSAKLVIPPIRTHSRKIVNLAITPQISSRADTTAHSLKLGQNLERKKLSTQLAIRRPNISRGKG